MKKLSLFVWTGFCPDYTSGLAFALAPDEKTARELIVKERGYNPWNWGALNVYPITKQIAKCVSGGG